MRGKGVGKGRKSVSNAGRDVSMLEWRDRGGRGNYSGGRYGR